MTKRNFIWLLVSGLFTAVSFADAQQARNPPKIAFLSSVASSNNEANLEIFRQSLRELGYAEGKNIIIEYRAAEGNLDRVSELATDLVNLKVNIILTIGMPAVTAAKRATDTIPIVTANADNLVEAGLIASLARPGGNVTGSTRVDADFSGKRLELLRETFPKLSRVAVISHGSLGSDQEELQETQAAAQRIGVEIHSVMVQERSHFLSAYAEILKRHTDALIFFTSAFTFFHRKELVELALKNRVPTMCASVNWTEAGCNMSYGPNVTEFYRRAAVFVDKILKGTKPGDIPVEQRLNSSWRST